MDAKTLMTRAHKVVVLTGAGMSVASGLPTYRGDGGIWETDPDAEKKSTPPPAKMCDPGKRRAWWDNVWARWGPMRGTIKQTGPNIGHLMLAAWAERIESLVVVTQNIDGLHQAAGSENVIELHGTLWRNRCVKRACSLVPFNDDETRDRAPDCPRCGRPLRPDVVLFGEQLNRAAVDAAETAVARADLVVVIGTSGNVHPAAGLPALADRLQVPVVRIDPGEWAGPHVRWADEVAQPADEALVDLLGT
jgi:NAD-dependent deacetylase